MGKILETRRANSTHRLADLRIALGGGLPKWVVGAKPEFIEDADGEAALSVLIVISPDKAEIFRDAQQLLSVKKLVRAVLRQRGVEEFPYFKFVSATDL